MLSLLIRHGKRGLRGLRAVFFFVRSIVAESIVWVLVLYAVTALVSFHLFLPIGLLGHVSRRGRSTFGESKILPSCPLSLAAMIFDNGIYSLPCLALRTALRTLAARPLLALAGWIVRQRLPAYTFCSGDSPPIRWWFEFYCHFANRHHYIIPDPEFYLRRALYALGIVGEASPLQLGTILPEEREQLRVFAHKYQAVTNLYSESCSEGYSGPKMPWFPLQVGEAAHYLCAEEVLLHAQERTDIEKGQHHTQPSQEAVRGGLKVGGKLAGDKAPPRISRINRLRPDVRSFSVMYATLLFYCVLRVAGEVSGALGPVLFEHPSSFEEYYTLHVRPAA